MVLSPIGLRLGARLLDSPHFLELCMQSSRYFSSLVRTASAAFWHSSLGSVHPASLHRVTTKEQHSATSFGLRATLFVRMRRHSSLARMHVRTCLNLWRVCSRTIWRVISKLFSSKGL